VYIVLHNLYFGDKADVWGRGNCPPLSTQGRTAPADGDEHKLIDCMRESTSLRTSFQVLVLVLVITSVKCPHLHRRWTAENSKFCENFTDFLQLV